MTKLSTETEILFVPSAVIVPDELRLDVGSIPTGMVPLRGKPVLERLGEAYPDKGLTRVVAVYNGIDAIRQYTAQSEYEWTIVNVGETTSLGETVKEGLSVLNSDGLGEQNLYINFADTLISPIQKIQSKDYITYQINDRIYRWTTFDINNGRISEITQKYKNSGDGPKPAFAGQFGITDASQFFNILNNIYMSSDDTMPLFYTALLSYLSDREYELYEPEVWLDVGHLDTYHRAKKQFLNSREFNELDINEKNVITKHSDDTQTLINEVEWYTQIPIGLQPYLPRLYNWSGIPPSPFLDLEYIGYPSLADLQLYSSHGQHIWNSIFHRLFQMVQEFQDYTIKPGQQSINKALETIYVMKTRRRLESVQEHDFFAPYFGSSEVTVNGRKYPSPRIVLDSLNEIVSDEGLMNQQTFSVIHGDLCLPNILYDPRNEILKLIDPRGEFGEFTIYGDPRYDIGKLRHSFVGHYEHLIYDHFTATASPSDCRIEYEIETTDAQDHREQRFDTVLKSQTDFSLRQIELIEALLYLSMVPLHSDSHKRQVCMLGQGIEKAAKFVTNQ